MRIDSQQALSQAAARQVDAEKLRKACGDFESLFINILLKNARDSMPEGGILGHSNESKVFNSLFDEKMAIQASSGKGLGLGEMLHRQLSPKPETAK